MKTLVIKYLPSGEYSNTKLLLDHALEKIQGQEVEVLDLLKDFPPHFDEVSLGAYIHKQYMGEELEGEMKEKFTPFEKLFDQLAAADVVIMAYPMHNFSMPGPIKLYFDAVMQKGKAFDYTATGPVGLLKGKKALTLFTSAGSYFGETLHMDTITALANIEFGHMGFDEIEILSTAGLRDPQTKEANLKEVYQKIDAVLDKWMK